MTRVLLSTESFSPPNMSNARDAVILDYAHLCPGDTLSGQMCPSCGGGRSREHSMSVGRKDQWLWWRCHRAGCGFKGSYTHSKVGPKSVKEATLNRLTYRVRPLAKSLSHKLCDDLHLSEGLISSAGWMWTEEYGGRVVMPIRSLDGTHVGDTLRSYNGDQPKAMINRLREGQILSWHSTVRYPSTLVMCEDQPSAVRLSGVNGVAGVALLGTELSYDKCLDIKRSKIKNLVLSLDEDATAKAVQHLVTYRHMLPTMRLVPLDEDIKNMDNEKFELYISEVIRND